MASQDYTSLISLCIRLERLMNSVNSFMNIINGLWLQINFTQHDWKYAMQNISLW